MKAAARGLAAAGATDVGRHRTNNEDRFLVDPARGIFIVADGVGGHAAGEQAAETAIAVMTERLTRQTGAVTDRLREAITIANNEIHRRAASRPDWYGMACVVTAAVVEGTRVFVGHVGDSRLYRLLDGRLEKITPDHSRVGEREDARELSEFEAMRHPRRNEVYRDVGSEPREVTDPDFVFVTTIDLPPGASLLLCSDGLTDLVPSDVIRRIALAHVGAPERVAQSLVTAANDAGGTDNVTAIYVEQTADPARPDTPEVIATRTPGAHPLTRALVLLIAALAGAVAGISWFAGAWPPWTTGPALAPITGGVVLVPAGGSIGEALASAGPGTTIVVEPGEYRERLTLRDNIRVVSQVPRGAVLRLPGGAAENDAAVVVVGVHDAELSGFRLVGDAATPLGIGVIVRDALVRLVDLEVSGAATSAIDLGPGDGTMLIGSDIHDNPGTALTVRTGASARITNNVFTRNANAERTPAPFIVEPGATPTWSHNVFNGVGPTAIAGIDDGARLSLPRENWFIAAPPATNTPARRGGRGR